jgi:hypothetical protein
LACRGIVHDNDWRLHFGCESRKDGEGRTGFVGDDAKKTIDLLLVEICGRLVGSEISTLIRSFISTQRINRKTAL